MKTNATRHLDKLSIKYQLRDYEVDPEDLSALKVASQIGLPPNQVFKTLCAKSDNDLKALARVSGHRSMALVPVSDLQKLTGYIRGEVTALACKKNYPVYFDESALRHSVIAVSAGVRGTQILLAPRDYAQATSATLGGITRLTAPN